MPAKDIRQRAEGGDSVARCLRSPGAGEAKRRLAMVLSEQDVLDLAETIEPGHSAAVLVWENQWAAPFGAAVRKAGGQLVASGRIPTRAVLAAFQADAESPSTEV